MKNIILHDNKTPISSIFALFISNIVAPLGFLEAFFVFHSLQFAGMILCEFLDE